MKRREEKYSYDLDFALPTPSKIELKQLEKIYEARRNENKILKARDASTSSRKSGRPKSSDYKVANPTRFSVGEMTNPF